MSRQLEGARWAGRIVRLGLVSLAVVTVGAVAAREASSKRSLTATQIQVEAFLTHYTTTLTAGEPEAIRRLYRLGKGFAWFEDGRLAYASPEAVIEGLDRLPPGSTIETELSNVRVVALADSVATASADFTSVIRMADGSTLAFNGVMTLVLERIDGHWRVVTGHSSTDRS